MYDQAVRDLGEESPFAKNLKDQLDTIYLKRSSPIAHLRNEKQVQDAILQFAQHLEKTRAAHTKVRDHEQDNLKSLEKMVEEQKRLIAKKEETFKAEEARIIEIQRQLA
eukprot:12127953-Karenia_brevis.AAC.1